MELITSIVKLFLQLKKLFFTSKAKKLYQYYDKLEKVESICKDIILSNNTGRAGVVLFHNGETFYNGTHHQKASSFAESTAPGVMSLIKEFQDVPLFQFASIFKCLISEGVYQLTVTDTPRNEQEANLQSLMKGVNTTSFCYFALVDKTGRLIGYLACCKCNSKNKKFTDSEIQVIKMKASRISAILFE